MAVYEQPLLRGFDDVPRIEKTESNSLAPHWRPLRAEPPHTFINGRISGISNNAFGGFAVKKIRFGALKKFSQVRIPNSENFHNSMTVG
jgi:hypothetical protein